MHVPGGKLVFKAGAGTASSAVVLLSLAWLTMSSPRSARAGLSSDGAAVGARAAETFRVTASGQQHCDTMQNASEKHENILSCGDVTGRPGTQRQGC